MRDSFAGGRLWTARKNCAVAGSTGEIMFRNHQSYLFPYLFLDRLAVATLVALGIAPTSAAAVTIEVVLGLTAPSATANRFGVSGTLNTLTPALGVMSEQGSVDLSGEITAVLHFDMETDNGLPVLTAIDFVASNLSQTPLTLPFSTPVGLVQFSTTQLSTELNSVAGPIALMEGEFDSNAVVLTQTGGMANVTVPLRAPELQDLTAAPIVSMFDLMQHAIQSASVSISPSGGDVFDAILEIPLDGQTLHFAGVGLPMALEFTGGTLRATGSFLLPANVIPEPTTRLLAAVAVAGVAARRFRLKRAG